MTATPQRWNELVSVALIGTTRRSAAPLDVLDRGLEPDPARQVLIEAAVLAVARRAAPDFAPPKRGVGFAPACRRVQAPPEANRLLDLVLRGMLPYRLGTEAMLEQWLTSCADAGWRVRDEQVPAVLHAATGAARLRESAIRATDVRGAWHAALEPMWSWFLLEDPDWDALSRPARREALRRAFATDPAAARARWRRLYETEPAGERAQLLALLAPYLITEDEPTIEAALDDRNSSVRGAAIAIAHRVPASGFRTRMAARLESIVAVRDHAVHVEVPTSPDAAGSRDGLGMPLDEPPLLGGGADVARIIGGTDLSWWETNVHTEPAHVVAHLPDDAAVATGFYRAAVAQDRADWLTELFQRFGGARWLGLVAPSISQSVVVTAGVPASADDFAGVITVVEGPWTDAFSHVVLDGLRRRRPGPRPRDCIEVRTERALAERLHHGLADDLNHIAATTTREHPGARAWRSIAGAVTFRSSVASSFTYQGPR